MSIRAATAFVLVLLSAHANAQDRCTAQGQAEQERIQREFVSNRPAKDDKDAQVTWARNLNAALAAAARRAEDCARAARQAEAPAIAARERECAARAIAQADELDKRYRGRSLSPQEQAARRSEEDRLLQERMSCIRGQGR